MKLFYSFIKELKLSSKSFYFYIEIFMALIFLILLLFIIPNNFDAKATSYIYFDVPKFFSVFGLDIDSLKNEDIDGKSESVEFKIDGEIIKTEFYETEDSRIYVANSAEDVELLAENKQNLGIVIDGKNLLNPKMTYYMQGYESKKMKNLYKLLNNRQSTLAQTKAENQRVVNLMDDVQQLSDKENLIPVFLTFNGALMGMFIISAYIFLDKKEGIIKAYAVTASSVATYLLSKVGVITVTTIVTSFIILFPVMLSQPNYILFFIFLIATSFFSSSLGLLFTSFFEDIMQSFGAIFVIIVGLMLPNIAYFIPFWDPVWIKIIPSYPMIQGFKEIISPQGDADYVLIYSGIFILVGLFLFIYANFRFKKTLTV